MIDFVVEEPNQTMTYITGYEKAFIDREASFETDTLELEGIKRIIARRAAMELPPKGFVNLGYGSGRWNTDCCQRRGIAGQDHIYD